MLDSPGPLDKGQKAFFSVTPIPEDWTPEQAESYLMLHERWYMFAPEAPRTDMNVSIDAVTAAIKAAPRTARGRPASEAPVEPPRARSAR